MRRVGRLAASCVAALALAAHAQTDATPDVPAGDARIEGRVLGGDPSRGVPNVEVVLYALARDGTPGLRRAQSDASGAYRFEGVSSAPEVAYLIGARYGGIPVPGGRVTFAPGEKRATADVHVADLSSDASRVRVHAQTLRLYREADGLRVEETLALEQTGAEIAYVPPAERASRAPGLRTALPDGAADFRMPLGVIPEGLAREGSSLRYYGPFYPGSQELVWSYRLRGGAQTSDGERFRLVLTPAQGVEVFSLLVPEELSEVEAPALTSAGTESDQGRTVRRFRASRPRGPLPVAFSARPARVDPGAISTPEVQIVLHADDAAITVTESHLLSVRGAGMLLGTPGSPLLRVPVPADASDLRFGSEASGLEFSLHPGGGVAVLGSLAPGETPIQLAYRVPVSERGARLVRSFGTRIPLLRVFVADTGRLLPESARLHRGRPVRTEDLNYLSLEAFDVGAGEELALALEPLPARGAARPAVAQALAALAALGLVAWLFTPVARRTDERPGDESQAESPARAEREAIYEAIRDLDHDFETAKLSAEDHARLRGQLRVRAAALLAAEEHGGIPLASADGPRACARCSASAAPEHRFCAACGAPLETPAA